MPAALIVTHDPVDLFAAILIIRNAFPYISLVIALRAQQCRSRINIIDPGELRPDSLEIFHRVVHLRPVQRIVLVERFPGITFLCGHQVALDLTAAIIGVVGPHAVLSGVGGGTVTEIMRCDRELHAPAGFHRRVDDTPVVIGHGRRSGVHVLARTGSHRFPADAVVVKSLGTCKRFAVDRIGTRHMNVFAVMKIV